MILVIFPSFIFIFKSHSPYNGEYGWHWQKFKTLKVINCCKNNSYHNKYEAPDNGCKVNEVMMKFSEKWSPTKVQALYFKKTSLFQSKGTRLFLNSTKAYRGIFDLVRVKIAFSFLKILEYLRGVIIEGYWYDFGNFS